MPGVINFCFEYPLKTKVGGTGEQLEELDAYLVRTIRHELFHAIQFRYGIGGDDWIMEGQAALASQAPELRRDDSVVHMDMRDSLIAEGAGWGDMSPHKTQDFWRYFALRHEPPLGYDPMFPVVSERDVSRALALALHGDRPGVYNVAGGEQFPHSELCAARERPRGWLPLPDVWRDLAGLLRSLDYAAWTAAGPAGAGQTARAAAPWRARAGRAFLEGYLAAAGDCPGVPRDRAAFARLLDLFTLEKACYEVRYEMAHRPPWLPVPMPMRLSFRPVLPSVTRSVAVGLAGFFAARSAVGSSAPPASAAVTSINCRRSIFRPAMLSLHSHFE